MSMELDHANKQREKSPYRGINIDSDIVRDLIKRRGICKGRLTKFATYVSTLEDTMLTSQKRIDCKLRIQGANSLFREFNDIQTKLEESVSDIDEQLTQREQFENSYYSILSRAEYLLNKGQDSSNSTSTQRNSIKLPIISMPTFNGAYEQWLEFRDTFLSLVHNSSELSSIEKFHYLKSSLKSSAELVIDSVEFSSDNYIIAWELLVQRYNNNSLLIQNHIKSIFTLQSLSRESPVLIRKLIDTVLKNLRALKMLGEPTETWDTLIIYIIVSKLDQTTEREWEEYKGNLFTSDSKNKPTIDNLLQFLQNRANMLESLQLSHSKASSDNKKPNSHNHSKIHCNFSSNKVQERNTRQPFRNLCLFCNTNHPLYSCQKFIDLNLQDKLKFVGDKHLCTNCLRFGHSVENCRFGPCRWCNRKHNTLLHDNSMESGPAPAPRASEHHRAGVEPAAAPVPPAGSLQPDTVPQASIDMTSVLEVSEADAVTGHAHSLAITAPERVTFVKGTCREETRWWADVLNVYPRSKGRHKRNATFPGGQTGSLLQTSATRKYSADASTLRDAADGRGRHFSVGTTTWPGPRVQPPQPEIPSLAPPPLDTKVYTDQPVSSASPPTRDKINGEEKARSRRRDTWAESTSTPPPDDASVRSPLLHQHQQYDEQLRDIAASLTRPRSRRALPPTLERPTRLPPPDRLPARGTPDGGIPPEEGSSSSGSDGSEHNDVTETSENAENGRVELPAERLLHARAGWLQRKGLSGWSRHWFVLRGAALLYFRDPHAEHRGLMDGVIDLSGVARVVELPTSASTNGYAFETETWDGKHIILSAVTAGIRANWVSAMRRTAGLPDTGPLSLILRDDAVDQTSESSTSPITPVTPGTGKIGPFSSDEEYRTASEGGRRDSADWGDLAPHPPPSPILSRTPISKVKEKVRARGCHQTTMSKPDAIKDKDEIDATKEKHRPADEVDENEKPSEPRKRSYISTIDKQSIEIDDLRKQLKLALTDVDAAEAELARLRKLKSEAALKDKKMEDLVITLQKKEEELILRTKEAENLDTLKQMYNQDKSLWESKLTDTQNFLKESTEHCELLTKQLNAAQETIQHLQRELNELNERLIQSVKENDNLYTRIRELEGRATGESPTKEKRKSIGSLSDLSNLNQNLDLDSLEKNKLIEEYVELRERFLRAMQEIKAMKKELRDSHSVYDELEVTNMKLRNEMKLREQCSNSEIDLMAARIQDLTQKLTASDKQVRTLKHKIQKTESREKRRSLSLKGRESFTLSKEVEEKLTELENKISLLETGEAVPTISTPSKSSSPTKEKTSKSESADEKRMKRLAARLRRKSLDSATSSEPMKMLVRLSSLETKVASALVGRDFTASSESLAPSDPAAGTPPSHRHLLERLHSLETVVIHSRNKVNECLCQMSAMRAAKTRRSPSPSLDKKYSIKSMEKCLSDVSKQLQECFDKCVVESEDGDMDPPDEHVMQAVVQLEEQLTAKLLDISRRKAALLEAGELTPQRSLELLAEKLAYEAVLVGRIQEALESTDGGEFFARLIKLEIFETGQSIDELKRKLNGENGRGVGGRGSLELLAKLLARRGARPGVAAPPALALHAADLDRLKAAQRDLAADVERFIDEKVAEMRQAAGDAEEPSEGGEAALRGAWDAAREALGSQLAAAEVRAALGRAAARAGGGLAAARRARPALCARERADLELWWLAAHDQLRHELDRAARTLAARGVDTDCRQLAQLADVLAHKALVDARVAVLDGSVRAAPPAPAAPALALHDDPAQEAEFVYLFQHFSGECRALFSGDCSGDSDDSMKIGASLARLEAAVAEVVTQLGGEPGAEEAATEAGGAGAAVLARVEALRARVEALRALVPCQHCKQLQEALDRLQQERQRSECALAQQASALAAARRARAQLQAQHERERGTLRERARTLQRRLAALDSEYAAQLDALRAAYQSAVAADAHGDSLRARYQHEIEQLRALCEKGLLAMESSHRRIVRDIEDKHRSERDQLRLEKEQALAEETRATLAALDAMRKAHETEVRREVDKFKAEFAARAAASDLPPLTITHQQEMEEIKREILSLSEKYSVKCVESAALEERLATATAQLAHAHNHIMQLDSRNKQLRAHIMSEANDIKCTEASSLPQLIEDAGPHGGEAPLWTHLRRLAASWQRPGTGDVEFAGGCAPRQARQDTVRQDRNHTEPAVVSSAELKSPRRCSAAGRHPTAPLLGMVAERKKLFEL